MTAHSRRHCAQNSSCWAAHGSTIARQPPRGWSDDQGHNQVAGPDFARLATRREGAGRGGPMSSSSLSCRASIAIDPGAAAHAPRDADAAPVLLGAATCETSFGGTRHSTRIFSIAASVVKSFPAIRSMTSRPRAASRRKLATVMPPAGKARRAASASRSGASSAMEGRPGARWWGAWSWSAPGLRAGRRQPTHRRRSPLRTPLPSPFSCCVGVAWSSLRHAVTRCKTTIRVASRCNTRGPGRGYEKAR